LSPGFNMALWRWENAPYMQAKKALLQHTTRHYIETVAANPAALKSALKEWLRIMRIEHDLQDYLRPRRIVEKLDKMHEYQSTGQVDVNKIDIGVEYTARFQGQFSVESSSAPMADGMEAWLYTKTDMTPYERREQIRKMAKTLGQELNGGRTVEVIDITNGTAHGHGMSVTFQVADSKGRKWRVEWDGVGRTYTEDGKVIPESLRGGHMEIVTPKMTPRYEEMSAVFRAMNRMNVIPSHSGGGGHLNVDLAPFAGNPRALARFLTLFHEHRGMISFLFTNVNRVSVAEPVDVSADFSRKLRDFQGTELELKQLLYNEGYYNQRLGRKTRNVQIDMSGFFQDIIPAEHIHPDFDFKNPTEAWRPQFRVNPKIRKMEMRLFDAPIDAFESSMQIKLVKALIDKALNSQTPLSGRVQEVKHENFTGNYEFAKGELARMCQGLGLSVAEYKIFLARAFVQGRQNMSSRFYQNYRDKIRERGWNKVRKEVWGRALPQARSESEALSSETRQWQGSELPEDRAFRERRIQAAGQGTQLREQLDSLPDVRREIKIGVNCRAIFR
ncbi:MAG: amidoligase family protein, partial [Bdellovibrionota bacterium]